MNVELITLALAPILSYALISVLLILLVRIIILISSGIGTKIIKAPGYNFSIFGKLIFTKKSYERVIEPAILTMQEEYFEAYSQKRFAMARWIRFRFFFIFLQIVGMNLPLISSLLELKEKFTSK